MCDVWVKPKLPKINLHRNFPIYSSLSSGTYITIGVDLLKGEVYPKIKFSPVVVFGVLSRMVLVRGR